MRKENRIIDLNKLSEIYCPKCGKRSYTKVKWGEVIVHCKRCKSDFEVSKDSNGTGVHMNSGGSECRRAGAANKLKKQKRL